MVYGKRDSNALRRGHHSMWASALGWGKRGAGTTDADGRCKTLMPAGAPLEPATWAIRFDTAAYFVKIGVPDAFYPEARIVFTVRAGAGSHFHVPLLLSPFGYTTYRGT